MEKEIIWTPQATLSLATVLIYLETEWSKKIATGFLDEFLTQLAVLKTHPEIGIQSAKKKFWRKILITKHNALIYRIDKDKIILLNIIDTRTSGYHI